MFEDAMNMVGFVDGHVSYIKMYWGGNNPPGALALHHKLLPAYCGFFRTQGVIMTKAALRLAGKPAGPVRLPLCQATPAEIARIREDCAASGLTLGDADQMAHLHPGAER